MLVALVGAKTIRDSQTFANHLSTGSPQSLPSLLPAPCPQKKPLPYHVRMTIEMKATRSETFPTRRAIPVSPMRKARRVPENGTEIRSDLRDKMEMDWLVTRN